ncbi:sodium:proton antiporter [Fundidesulfovibrio butyratiphilus]
MRLHRIVFAPLAAGLCFLASGAATALAQNPDAHHLAETVGTSLGLVWVAPFAGMLLSIAVFPLAAPHFWERHYGKAAAFWALAYLVPFAVTHGVSLGLYQVAHTVLTEYLPFIILLLTLFTIAGGVCLTGSLVGRPLVNTGMLLLGTALASWMGTTGAAMLLVRPLLRANAARRHKAHTLVFFIFLVANIGGCLTPLGDPPLFLGFLKGVSFFWTTTHLFAPFALVASILLALYLALDSWLYARERKAARSESPPETQAPSEPAAKPEKLRLEGAKNLPLLLGVVAAVLMSGIWRPDAGLTVFHVRLEAQNLLRDAILLVLTGVSLRITDQAVRRKNAFDWAPILEVAKLFAGIFLSMIPAIAILKAGPDGALAPLVALVSDGGKPLPAMYFWLCGGLSSFLDNAPTYLVFFNTAGGDAQALMTQAGVLSAVSAGAVFMGANSYIGNAPNFMVRSIAESGGVKMPSFFGYMLWSGGILVPCFLLTAYVFFR